MVCTATNERIHGNHGVYTVSMASLNKNVTLENSHRIFIDISLVSVVLVRLEDELFMAAY